MAQALIDPEEWESLPDVTAWLEPVAPGDAVDPREVCVIATVYEDLAPA
jgi:hypothetical protein